MIGYTSWHLLLVYSCVSCPFIYIHIVIQLSFSYLFIMLFFSYLLSTVYLVIIQCILFICTSTSLYTHTHKVTVWQPWIRTSRYWTLCFYYSGVRWDCTLHEELEFLPIWFRYSYLLPSCYFLILDISDSVVILVLYFYDIMRGCLYVILQQSWFIIVSIYSLFQAI